ITQRQRHSVRSESYQRCFRKSKGLVGKKWISIERSPTIWSASATDILEKVKRAQAALLQVNPSEALHKLTRLGTHVEHGPGKRDAGGRGPDARRPDRSPPRRHGAFVRHRGNLEFRCCGDGGI